MTAKNLALATITGTARTAPPGRTPSRSFGDRIKDVYNVKDFGAKGDFSTDDTAAIQLCIDQAGIAFTGGDGLGGTVFFPPGGYIVGPATSGAAYGINISGTAGNFSGRIVGSGRNPTFISGNVPNGFTFMQGNGGGGNGPSEIAHMAISNGSLNIGSGALCIGNGSAHIHDVGFGGQINVYLPFNIYDMLIENCGGGSNMVGSLAAGGTGHIGTLGIAGYAPHIKCWRSTNVFQTCFQLWGSNGCALIGNGIENCEVAYLLGMNTGWASHCTVADDILTAGGMLNAGDPLFGVGLNIFMTGLPMKAWSIDPNETTTGTTILTNAEPTITDGTTTISGSTMTVNGIVGNAYGHVGYGLRVGAVVEGTGVLPNTTITAVPGGGNASAGNYTVTPGSQSVSATTITSTDAKSGVKLTGINGLGTYRINRSGYSITTPVPMWSRGETALVGVTVSSFQNEGCHYGIYANSIGAAHIASAGGNSASNEAIGQYGQVGWTPHSGFYIRKTGGSVFSGCAASSHCHGGGFYFEDGQPVNNTTFISCAGNKTADNAVTASISSDILTVTGLSAGGGIGIGLAVTGSGVTAGTVIIGSRASEPDIPVTLTIANPAVFTKTAHGLVANDQITFEAFTGLPPGLTAVTTYYVITAGMTADTFKVSASPGPGTAVSTVGGTTSNPDQRIGHSYAKVNGSAGLTGYNNIGTYRVNNSQTSSPTGVNYGPDWKLPTNTSGYTGLELINCGTSESSATTHLTRAMTFTSLPGETGSSGYIPRYEGQEYSITDGCKSLGPEVAAVFGDTVIGGGHGHYKVRYNGTNWTRCG